MDIDAVNFGYASATVLCGLLAGGAYLVDRENKLVVAAAAALVADYLLGWLLYALEPVPLAVSMSFGDALFGGLACIGAVQFGRRWLFALATLFAVQVAAHVTFLTPGMSHAGLTRFRYEAILGVVYLLQLLVVGGVATRHLWVWVRDDLFALPGPLPPLGLERDGEEG